MNLKYYLRGLGIGILVTATIMGISASGGTKDISNAEIIARARALGMVENKQVIADLEAEGAGEAVDNEISGENSAGNADAGKAVSGNDIVGNDVAGNDIAGNDALGSDTVGNDVSGSDIVGKDVAGSDIVGKDAAGNDIVGKDAAGNDRETLADGADDSSDLLLSGNEAPPNQSDAAGNDTVSDQLTQANPGTVPDQAGSERLPEQSGQGLLPSGNNKEYTIEVRSGDSSYAVSSRLAEAGLVSSAAEYDRYLCDNNYDNILRVGSHQIPAGSDQKTIAEIITGRR